MRKGILVLLAVMVILAGFSLASASSNETNHSQNESCIPSVFIDPKVTVALQNNESVYVGVGIRDMSGIVINPSMPRKESIILLNQIEEYKRNISEQIRSNLTLDEFNVTRVAIDGTIFFGRITRKGLEKLNSSCYIKNIAIPLRGSGSDEENQTLPYVDPAIYQNFDSEGWVPVIVRTIDISNITINPDDPVEKNLRIFNFKKLSCQILVMKSSQSYLRMD